MSASSKVKVAINKDTIQVIRSVCNEMKCAAKQIKNKDNESIKHFVKQCRLYQTTDERTCNGKNERRFVAETYLTYLESTRKYQHINRTYTSKGERSVEEAARLVGLKLPNSKY